MCEMLPIFLNALDQDGKSIEIPWGKQNDTILIVWDDCQMVWKMMVDVSEKKWIVLNVAYSIYQIL